MKLGPVQLPPGPTEAPPPSAAAVLSATLRSCRTLTASVACVPPATLTIWRSPPTVPIDTAPCVDETACPENASAAPARPVRATLAPAPSATPPATLTAASAPSAIPRAPSTAARNPSASAAGEAPVVAPWPIAIASTWPAVAAALVVGPRPLIRPPPTAMPPAASTVSPLVVSAQPPGAVMRLPFPSSAETPRFRPLKASRRLRLMSPINPLRTGSSRPPTIPLARPASGCSTGRLTVSPVQMSTSGGT